MVKRDAAGAHANGTRHVDGFGISAAANVTWTARANFSGVPGQLLVAPQPLNTCLPISPHPAQRSLTRWFEASSRR